MFDLSPMAGFALGCAISNEIDQQHARQRRIEYYARQQIRIAQGLPVEPEPWAKPIPPYNPARAAAAAQQRKIERAFYNSPQEARKRVVAKKADKKRHKAAKKARKNAHPDAGKFAPGWYPINDLTAGYWDGRNWTDQRQQYRYVGQRLLTP